MTEEEKGAQIEKRERLMSVVSHTVGNNYKHSSTICEIGILFCRAL